MGACLVLVVIVLIAATAYELRNSPLQSYLLTRYAATLSYEIDAGPSPQIAFPNSGPYDQRLGYVSLPEFSRRLQAHGYRIIEQARMSERMAGLQGLGITPPYPEPPTAGLVISASAGEVIFDRRRPALLFERYEDIPPPVAESLLFIEDRKLLAAQDPRRNPAIDWGRLGRAGLLYAGRQFGIRFDAEGGSTLATQMEKFRHSPGGRTASAGDKLRQMTAASLEAYRTGVDTRDARRRIVLDYLNSMPLAAVPGYGEVHGLGEGLHAWFDLDLGEVRHVLLAAEDSPQKAAAFKHVLALQCAVRSPTRFLVEDRAALEARVAGYTRLLARAGVISADLGARARETPLRFAEPRKIVPQNATIGRKGIANVRTQLLDMVDVSRLYDLDRLNLEVRSTLDLPLQQRVNRLLRQLQDPEFLAEHGLRGERLLSLGDPGKVLYSLMLYEATPQGNLLRVHADSLDQPFDLNAGMKMELGSTAKLRTLAHYLELVAGLYESLAATAETDGWPDDPITRWAVRTMQDDPSLELDEFLRRSLERTYSASPREVFFTGGGVHTFRNFDAGDNARVLSVRAALVHSTNLVFIRLMRDLVRFHTVRLPYDAEAVLADAEHPVRLSLLEEIAEEEATATLLRAYERYHGVNREEVVRRALDGRISPRRLTVLFYAWGMSNDADHQALARWLKENGSGTSPTEVLGLARSYNNPRLTIADYGYLLDVHPLDLWAAGQLLNSPSLIFAQVNAGAADAKRISSRWLFQTRNRNAQDLRLRTRIERDAVERMTPYWQRLGFPFDRLVPSYATAIGSSSDRPTALAELMGIIVNDGLRRPAILVEQLRFAAGTPYHTVFGRDDADTERAMHPSVARTLRRLLAEVVEEGTGRRLKGAFHLKDGSLVTVGGKTGSGDNRHRTFASDGSLKTSRAVNRTATFVFYIGDRYYGVVTASVDGADAQDYRFTSALPLAVLELLARDIEQRLERAVPFLDRSWELAGARCASFPVEHLGRFRQFPCDAQTVGLR